VASTCDALEKCVARFDIDGMEHLVHQLVPEYGNGYHLEPVRSEGVGT
jgi:hypothetical protein